MRLLDELTDGRGFERRSVSDTAVLLAGMDHRRSKQSDEPDFSKCRMTVASNYFALACPIMPLGLLGAFFALGQADNFYSDSLEERQNKVAELHTDRTKALYVAAMRAALEAKKFETADATGQLGACKRNPVESARSLKELERKHKSKASAGDQPAGQQRDVVPPSVIPPQPVDVTKLVKNKMALQALLEERSQEQDFLAVSRLSSKLDLLDKALKRAGC